MPFESVAESRSTIWDVASRPEPASVPSSGSAGPRRSCTRGRPESAADAPVGPVVSFVTVNVAVEVEPAPFVTVTVCEPDAVVELIQV